ncbi:MAG: leucine-rich repeat protein, partial [Oscillospiraceae bacterium]|nr:leucine-rich repeat protein [Oscillospiraceae bacterium]
SVGDCAFTNFKYMESASIPSGVTRIGEQAFEYCEYLEAVTIPSTVKYIGKSAFYDCKSIETIKIPSGVTEIKDSAFSHCSNLESVSIPSTVTKIGMSAFNWCTDLKDVTIPSGVTYIGGSAFKYTAIETIKIPSGVTEIPYSAFAWCDNLESVTIPSTVKTIGDYAFADTAIETIKIPSSVISIGEYAFHWCESLESVSIPSGIKVIRDDTFSYCGNLKSVTIPSSVTTIKDGAFDRCESLETVFYTGTKTAWSKIEIGESNEPLTSATIIYNTKKLTAPTVTVSNIASSGKIKLSWNAQTNAKQYKVYRSASETGTYSLVKTTTSTSWTDENAYYCDEYYYKVKAIHYDTAYNSNYSAPVHGIVKLSAPTFTLSLNSSGKPVIKWSEMDGAVSFKVAYSTSKDGTYSLLKETTGTSVTHTGAVAGKTYWYKVRAICENSARTGQYGTPKSITAASAKLATPTMTVSVNSTSGKPVIKWNAVDGAASYKVAYCTTQDGTYKLLKDTTDTSFTHTAAEAGEKYYYKVRAIHSDSAKNGAYCSPKYVTCDLAKPTLTVSLNSSNQPVIKWSDINNAAKYELYFRYSDEDDESYRLLKSTTSTSFTHTEPHGETILYKVRAIHSNSAANSAFSAVKSISVSKKLPAPVVTVSLNSNGKPVVKWNAVNGATEYELRFSDSKYELYESECIYRSTTSWTHEDAAAGQTYWYMVCALGDCDVYEHSDYSTAVSITTKAAKLATPTMTLSVNATSGKPVIKWNAVSDAVSYKVAYCTTKDGTYKLLKDTESTSVTHTGAVAGEKYYYKVRAIHSDSERNGAYCSPKYVTCDLAKPTLTVSLDATSGKPVIKWNAVEVATKYQVVYYCIEGGEEEFSLLKETTGTSYTHTGAVAEAEYCYKVRAIHSNSAANSAYSAQKTITTGREKFATPVVTVSLNSNGKPVIKWNKISNSPSPTYRLVYSTSKDGSYINIDADEDGMGWVYGTSYTHTNAVANTTYWYKVCAFDEDGTIDSSAYSTPVSITTPASKLATPTMTLSLDATSGKPVIKWNAVSGAVSYKVAYCTTQDGEYKLLKDTTSTSVTHTSAVAGEKYYYKVRAIHSDSARNGVYCSPKYVTCDLPAPTITVSLNSNGKPVIKWNAVDGATKYQVNYQCSGEAAEDTVIATTTGTSYTHTSADLIGEIYYYKVRAIHSNSAANSAYSAQKYVTLELSKLATPAMTVSLNSNGKPVVKWNAVSGATAYTVIYSMSKDGLYDSPNIETASGTSWTHTDAESDSTYWYMVKAIDDDGGRSSEYCSPKSITTPVPKLATPAMTVSLNEDGKPVIKWNAVSGAVSYKVAYCTTQDGTYTLLKDTTSTSVTHTAAVAGTTYWYKVRAISEDPVLDGVYGSPKSITAIVPKLATPAITVSLNEDGKPVISWNAVEGAVKYEIAYDSYGHEGDFDDENYSTLAETTSTSFTHSQTGVGVYCYKVRAIHTDSALNSEYSTKKSIACNASASVNSTSGKPVIRWHTLEEDKGYLVRCAASPDGPFTLIAQVDSHSMTGEPIDNYTHKDAVIGTKYWYKVYAFDRNEIETQRGDIVSAVCQPPVVTIDLSVNIDAATGKPVISWNKVEEAASYKVAYCTTQDGEYKLLKDATSTTVTHTSAVAGTEYWYKVRPIFEGSTVSTKYCDPLSETCDLPQPTVTVSINEDGKPVISWDAVDDTMEYRIYSSLYTGSELPNRTLLTSSTGTSVTHTAAVAGETYTYYVRAIHSNGTANSAYSKAVSVYVPV